MMSFCTFITVLMMFGMALIDEYLYLDLFLDIKKRVLMFLGSLVTWYVSILGINQASRTSSSLQLLIGMIVMYMAAIRIYRRFKGIFFS